MRIKSWCRFLLAATLLLMVVVAYFAATVTQPTKFSEDTPTSRSAHQDFEDDWLHVQELRKSRVNEVCDRHPGAQTQALRPEQLMVSDSHRTVYCMMEKVGTTTWLSFFLRLGGDPDYRRVGTMHNLTKLHEHGLTRLSKYNQPEASRILADYKKFLVVRHPYERLHSAFTDKFPRGGSEEIPRKYGPMIQDRYPHVYGSRPRNMITWKSIHFEDFVRFIGDKGVPMEDRTNRHWEPFHQMCSPCALKYDYILKMETFGSDSENLIGLFNTTLKLDQLNAYRHTNLTAYKDIPSKLMGRLWDMYKLDFKLFGYEWPGV